MDPEIRMDVYFALAPVARQRPLRDNIRIIEEFYNAMPSVNPEKHVDSNRRDNSSCFDLILKDIPQDDAWELAQKVNAHPEKGIYANPIKKKIEIFK